MSTVARWWRSQRSAAEVLDFEGGAGRGEAVGGGRQLEVGGGQGLGGPLGQAHQARLVRRAGGPGGEERVVGRGGARLDQVGGTPGRLAGQDVEVALLLGDRRPLGPGLVGQPLGERLEPDGVEEGLEQALARLGLAPQHRLELALGQQDDLLELGGGQADQPTDLVTDLAGLGGQGGLVARVDPAQGGGGVAGGGAAAALLGRLVERLARHEVAAALGRELRGSRWAWRPGRRGPSAGRDRPAGRGPRRTGRSRGRRGATSCPSRWARG
nr:hypothetical protein [Aquihabitans sp. G128]